jgi:hypothetical protein
MILKFSGGGVNIRLKIYAGWMKLSMNKEAPDVDHA